MIKYPNDVILDRLREELDEKTLMLKKKYKTKSKEASMLKKKYKTKSKEAPNNYAT